MERLEKEIFERFQSYNQFQVFKFWDRLNSDQRLSLIRQADKIDMWKLSENLHALLFIDMGNNQRVGEKISPLNYIPLPQDETGNSRWDDAYRIGEQVLSEHRVAVLTVAGGQGTRLGFEGPKGTFEVSPVSNKSLFQILAEKIKAAEKRYGYSIHWFIMTSDRNHNETLTFFGKRDSFGLRNVHFIKQGLMPAVDFNGKILLESPGVIAMHPDGHGGAFRALVSSGGCSILEEQGIDVVNYTQVDNPLVNVIDPSFIGFHVKSNSEMSSRMVFKNFPEEKLGLFCSLNGRPYVLEYCDFASEKFFREAAQENLLYKTGNAGIHILNRDFIKKLGVENTRCPLALHPVKKKIPTINDNGIPFDPEVPNGIKFEKFVFDALEFAQNPIVVEGNRKEIFSPVKNSKGLDSPETCKKDQLRLFAKWLSEAGADIPTDATGEPPFNIEISPSFADNEREFLRKWNCLETKPAIIENSYLE